MGKKRDTQESDMPLISVVVLIYNCSEYLEECLESLFNQTYKNLEFIIIDDASTDGSRHILNDVLRRYLDRSASARIINHVNNRGVSVSRKEGLEMASGDWVIYCDADDFVERWAYEKMYEAAREYDVDMVGCSFTTFGKGLPLQLHREVSGYVTSTDLTGYICGSERRKVHGALWNKLIRRELWTDVVFPENLSYCEDVVSLFQILLKNPRIFYLEDALYNYRIREGSLIKNKDGVMKRQCDILIPLFEKMIVRYGGDNEVISKAAGAKITGLLYRLIKSHNIPDRDIYKTYCRFYDRVSDNQQLNILEKLHIRAVLRNHRLLAQGIEVVNNLGYRMIMIFRSFLTT